MQIKEKMNWLNLMRMLMQTFVLVILSHNYVAISISFHPIIIIFGNIFSLVGKKIMRLFLFIMINFFAFLFLKLQLPCHSQQR